METCESLGNMKSPAVFQPPGNTQLTIERILQFNGKLEKTILNEGEWTFMKATAH